MSQFIKNYLFIFFLIYYCYFAVITPIRVYTCWRKQQLLVIIIYKIELNNKLFISIFKHNYHIIVWQQNKIE